MTELLGILWAVLLGVIFGLAAAAIIQIYSRFGQKKTYLKELKNEIH